jgi:hypothetical protein
MEVVMAVAKSGSRGDKKKKQEEGGEETEQKYP